MFSSGKTNDIYQCHGHLRDVIEQSLVLIHEIHLHLSHLENLFAIDDSIVRINAHTNGIFPELISTFQ